jgi:hypothetical protein
MSLYSPRLVSDFTDWSVEQLQRERMCEILAVVRHIFCLHVRFTGMASTPVNLLGVL